MTTVLTFIIGVVLRLVVPFGSLLLIGTLLDRDSVRGGAH